MALAGTAPQFYPPGWSIIEGRYGPLVGCAKPHTCVGLLVMSSLHNHGDPFTVVNRKTSISLHCLLITLVIP